MKFHTGVPMSAPKYDPEAISALARKADEVGYHYIGGAERLIMPRVIHSLYPRGTGEIPGVGSGQNMLEAQSTMSFIAGQTKQIRLMPFFVVPYRNPILAAKMLATIDVLSNGRMNILIGPGLEPRGGRRHADAHAVGETRRGDERVPPGLHRAVVQGEPDVPRQVPDHRGRRLRAEARAAAAHPVLDRRREPPRASAGGAAGRRLGRRRPTIRTTR